MLSPTSIKTHVESYLIDENLIKRNIDYAASSLCNSTMLSNWSCQACLRAERADNMKYVTAFGDMKRAYGYIGVNENDESIYIVFRGTSGISDQLNDSFILQVPYLKIPIFSGFGALVHAGFLLDNYDLSKRYLPLLRDLLSMPKYKDYSISLIGHSLGGAVATLASIEIKFTLDLDWKRLNLYTYGSPRVGNILFAQWFNKQPMSIARTVSYNDLVPHLPPNTLSLWSHVQTEYWINSDNNTQYCNGKYLEDRNCANSLPPYELSVNQHLHYFDTFISARAKTNC